jgi:CHAT domain-containing protein/Tfp pilus assembly protein PilF
MAHRGEHPSVSPERKRQTVLRDLSAGLGLLLLFTQSAALSLPPASAHAPDPILQSAREATQQPAGRDDGNLALEPGRPVKRELAIGQQHAYRIRLGASQYLKAVIEQQGIDVIVQVSRPDAKQENQSLEFDSEARLQSPEEVVLVAESTGDYLLNVWPAQGGVAAGSYQIRVEELREATERDRVLHEARKLYQESLELQRMGRYDEALSPVARSLEIRERLLGANHPDVAGALYGLAILYYYKGDYAKAEPLYQRALAIREKLLGHEHPDVAHPLNGLAHLHSAKGEYEKAELLYRRALAIWEKALGPEHIHVAAVLDGLAVVHDNRGEYAKAEQLYSRALAILEKVLGPERLEVAYALNNLAKLYNFTGEYLKAEPLYGRALAIFEKSREPEHPDVATVLSNLANLYGNLGKYARAESLYSRALIIRERALGMQHPHVALSLNDLAALYRDQGEYEKAEPLYNRALAILEKALGPRHQNFALSLNNLAALYRDQGEYAKAEPRFRRALAILEKVLGPEHADVALTLHNLATLYRDLGDYEKAGRLFQQALVIRERALGMQHADVALTLHNLAAVYRDQGEYAKAEPLFQRALAIWESALGTQHRDVALTLNNLANIHRDRGDYEKGEPLYVRALAIRERALGPQHPDVAASLNDLANLYREQGEYTKAEPLYGRALAIREGTLRPQHPLVADTLNNLAVLYEAKGDPAQAIELQARANDIGEHNLALNLRAGSERQKLVYLALFSVQTDFTLSLHSQAAPDDRRALDLAFTTLLRRKGRGLDAMTDTIAALRRHARPEDRILFDQLTAARSQLAALTFRESMNKLDTYQTRLKPLEERIESLEADLSARSTRFRAEVQPVTLSAIQAALPTGGALIEFAVFTPGDVRTRKSKPPRYLAYVLPARGRPKWVDLGEAEPIDQAIDEWRKALRGRPDVKHLGRDLDEKVMRPVRSILSQMGNETRRLLIAPEGSLNLIPFAALVDEHYNYLVERYTISYLTSGRDLLRLQTSEQSKSPPLVVANPVFGRATEEATRGVHHTGNPRTGDLRPIDAAPFSFEPLPRTQGEAMAIKGVMPDSSVLLRRQATEAALKQVRSPRILHIATHGFFLDDQGDPPAETRGRVSTAEPSRFGGRDWRADSTLRMSSLRLNEWAANIKDPLLRSGLALSGANLGNGGDDDGVLTALETAGLDLSGTKLVVLSACETGVGEIKNGEGVQGLRRALVLAGSESQVISLWPVADEGTREMMIQYYRALGRGAGRSEGLRQVQLRMLRSKKRQHPFYWAAFIQSGEWANLEGRR